MYEDQSHQLNNLGAQLYNEGKIDQALKYFEDAIFIYPKNAQAHNNLGLCLVYLKKTGEAQTMFARAITIKPDYPEAHINLANCFFALRDYPAALRHYKLADSTLDTYPKNLLQVAEIYINFGENSQAEKYYRRVLKVDPSDVDAINNLGVALNRQDKFQASLDIYRHGIKLYPNKPDMYFNMAISYSRIEDYENAIIWLKRSLKVDPKYPLSLAHLINRIGYICEWKDRKKLAKRLDHSTNLQIKNNEKPSEQPFMNIIRVDNPQRNLTIANLYSQNLDEELRSIRKNLNFKFKKNSRKKFRLGFASDGFRNFPTAQNIIRVLELLDRNKFEIYLYSFGIDDQSHWRKRSEKLADKFTDISALDYVQAAKTIYSDKLDLLVDMKGYTGGSRIQIMALKPAPVIVSLLGYVGSTGSSFVDYLIADRIVVPQEHEQFYTEKIVLMPDTYWPTDNTIQIPKLNLSKKSFGLPEMGFVFCAFHTAYKIEPIIYKSWMNILKHVPNSVLWMLRQNDSQVKNLISEAVKFGIDPARLIFSPSQSKSDHLARLQLADLALDTKLVQGHTTTTDCLWAGIPVITILGKHFASRVSASMLSAVGLPELITKNLKEYEKLAINLATHPGKLKLLKSKLQTNLKTKPLFDTFRYTKNLERIFEEICHNH